MLLTFLLGGDSGPGPHAYGVGVAYPQFNGRLRLRAMSLRDAGPPAIVAAEGGERILVFRAIVSNGSPNRLMGNFDAVLADDDANTVVGRPLEDDWNLACGGAARTAAEFHVDPNFMPVELILIDTSEPDVTAFRFDVRATPRATGRNSAYSYEVFVRTPLLGTRGTECDTHHAMNISMPEAPESGVRREGAVLRFLRWLIEPPVGPQPAQLRVLRWLLRAVAFVLYAGIAGPADGPGNGSAGRRGGKTGM